MNVPLKILHTESSPNMGGQELRILLEMEHMRDLGCEAVLAARSQTPILAEARRRGLQAHSIPMHNRLDPISLAMLWRLMRRESIAIVNAHGSRDAWNAFLVARMLRIRTVRSRHVANPIRRHRIGQMVYGSLCDRIVTTSESILNGLIESGVDAGKIVTVPTGVDVGLFGGLPRNGLARKEMGIPPDVPLVGMVSVLRRDKGPDLFLDACNALLAERKDVWCVLVGDGWMREALACQRSALPHRDRIVLAGFRRDIPQVFAELDVAVLSARAPEGVPQAVLQAHAARVPVVATAVGGISEVASEGRTAFVAQPNDPADLARKIRRALEEPRLAAAQAARGHALVSASYSQQAMLARMAEIYRQLAGEPRSSQA